MMGYVYLVIAIISLTVLGVSYKLSDRLNCSNPQVNFFMLLSACAGVFVWAWVSGNLTFARTPMLIGAAIGVMIFISVNAFREATARGKLSTSWTVLQLSMVIPVLASMLFWRETPHLRHYAGFALTIAAVALLGVDMARARK